MLFLGLAIVSVLAVRGCAAVTKVAAGEMMLSLAVEQKMEKGRRRKVEASKFLRLSVVAMPEDRRGVLRDIKIYGRRGGGRRDGDDAIEANIFQCSLELNCRHFCWQHTFFLMGGSYRPGGGQRNLIT